MRTFFVIAVRFIIIQCCFWAVPAGSAAETRENWATEAFQKNCASVAFIQGDKVEERRKNSTDADRTFNGMGTGIIIDERGYIITNYHVVKDIREIQVTTYDQKPLIGTPEHKPHIATLVAKDTDTDLAIIKINVRTPLRPITFGRSHDLMTGEVCMAIGNPYGYPFSLTDGRISAIDREVGVNDTPLVYRRAIQTNTEINPGNSGGPLINADGEMIGINVAMRQGAIGIAFAIPVDQVVEVAAKLMGELVDQQISHGLTVSQNEPSDYNAFKRFIIRVESVESNSPAAQAGIQKGDILAGIGKYTVRNKLDFYRALLGLKANDEIAFTFFRNKEVQDTTVAVGTSKGGAFARRNVASPQAATVAPKTASNAKSSAESTAEWDKLVWENLGIQYAPIPTQEFEQTFQAFLSKFSGGVVVKAVRSGSPAEQAFITAGDVVVGLGQWETASANDVCYVAALQWSKLQKENESLRIDVIRDNMHYWAAIPLQ